MLDDVLKQFGIQPHSIHEVEDPIVQLYLNETRASATRRTKFYTYGFSTS